MKTISKLIIIVGATCLITLMILNLRHCNPETPVIITRIDTVTNVIYKDSIQYVSKTETEYILTVDLVELTDTVYIIEDVVSDYFALINYVDTLQNNSSALIIISDTLQLNRIKNRLAVIEVYNKTKIIQETPINLTVGAFYLQNSVFNSMGGKIGLNTLKNNFCIGFGTQKTILLAYDRKFKLRK